ncbi:MAG: hypothetical protein K2J16_00585 [Clostridia bacterium]|nr:hypothetical protein [Clostridia bacterium]
MENKNFNADGDSVNALTVEVTACFTDGDGLAQSSGVPAEQAEGVIAQTNTQTNVENDEINKCNLGKFKNPQELLRAYGELEREFTRRSQRLKELEKGKLSNGEPNDKQSNGESSDGEQLSDTQSDGIQPMMSDEEWKSAVDKFFTEIPAAKAFAKDIANMLIANPQMREDRNCLNSALVAVLADKFRTPEQLLNDGQFLNDYVLCSEKVRNAVISQYLDDVRRGMPPHTMREGGLQCVAPKVKPRTVEEAGIMFLKNNK